MSKKTTESKDKQTEQIQEVKQPEYVGELLLNGTVTLTAKTREELNDMIAEIPANCSYGAGAVGKNPETGDFTLRLDVIDNSKE